MCCKRRAARRNNTYVQRRPTLIRILVEHIIQKRQEKRALREATEYGTTSEKIEHGSAMMEEGRLSAETREIGEWEWIDEKKQLQMLDQRYPMRGPASTMTELPTYQAAVNRT
jgi:hypothetical protein